MTSLQHLQIIYPRNFQIYRTLPLTRRMEEQGECEAGAPSHHLLKVYDPKKSNSACLEL